jgi:hypothetical protein
VLDPEAARDPLPEADDLGVPDPEALGGAEVVATANPSGSKERARFHFRSLGKRNLGKSRRSKRLTSDRAGSHAV